MHIIIQCLMHKIVLFKQDFEMKSELDCDYTEAKVISMLRF